MPFIELGKMGNIFHQANDRLVPHERTFKRRVYFDDIVTFNGPAEFVAGVTLSDDVTVEDALLIYNSYGDFGGSLYAFDTSGRNILFLDASEGATAGPSFRLYGPNDSSFANDIVLVEQSGAEVFRYDDSVDRLNVSKDIDLGGTTDLLGTKDGDTDRSLVGNLGGWMYATGNQSIPNNTLTLLTFNASLFDDGHNNLANNRFDVPEDGWYFVQGTVRWNASVAAASAVGLQLFLNTTLRHYENWNGSAIQGVGYMSTSSVIKASTGDYFQVKVFQNSGGAVSTNGGSTIEVSLRVAALF